MEYPELGKLPASISIGLTMTQSEQTATPRVWLLFGQKAGDNNQVLALAEQLGWPYTIKQIHNQPWELLTSLALGATLNGVDIRHSSPLVAPWPDLVITAGRGNEPVARWIQQRSGNRARLVHIGRPWAPLASWDLIVTTPQYFLPAADNVLLNRLPLHRITPERLAYEASTEAPWHNLPRPYTVVLLGGDSGQFVFTAEKGQRLGQLVNRLVKTLGGVALVSDSRRTPAAASEAFWRQLSVPAWRHNWHDGQDSNPYMALLAQADQLVVTGESMSMLAEASATGKPLFIFDMSDRDSRWWRQCHNYRHKPLSHRLAMRLGPRRMRRDIARIQEALVADGRAVWLDSEHITRGELSSGNDVAPGGTECRDAAQRIRDMFG
ncbi:mitochondrial fission ELM1 family protein [Porticoccus sp.]